MNDETLKKIVLAIYAMQEETRELCNGGGTWLGNFFIKGFEESDKTDLEGRIADAADAVFNKAGKFEACFIEEAVKLSSLKLGKDNE